MSKLIPMEEAAQILGMTVDQLNELRSSNEIFGYRDGSNWKFKMSELERVAGEMDIELNITDAAKSADALSDSFGFDLSGDTNKDLAEADSEGADDLLLDADSSSGSLIEELDSGEYIEDSSVELLQDSLGDDSLSLDDGEELSLADSGLLKEGTAKNLDEAAADSGDLLLEDSGALKLEDSGDLLASDESVFDDEEELSFGSSSIKLASGSSKKLSDGADSANLLDDDAPSDSKKSPSDTGKMLGGGDDDDLLLSEDDLFSDELSVADSASFEDSAELSSDFEDSDLILDDSDSSTEITLEANKSGINLAASESGINLADEPLELGGSDIDALELPEDDEMIVLDDAADSDAATLMQEDDFNLTPLEASMDDDDSSGSQVIALEDSEIYADESSATILGDSEDFASEPAALLDDSFGGSGLETGPVGGYDPGMQSGEMMMPGAAMAAPAALPEAPYSLFQVLGLGLVASLLTMGGMVAYNLAQNMWLPQDQVIGSSVLNFFLRLTGMN